DDAWRLARSERLEFEDRHAPVRRARGTRDTHVARGHCREKHVVDVTLAIDGLERCTPVATVERRLNQIFLGEAAVPANQYATDRRRATEIHLKPVICRERTAPSRREITVDRHRWRDRGRLDR